MDNKILIVDDEKGIVTMLKNYFETQGYQIYTAFSGKEALEKVSCQPDIILLDFTFDTVFDKITGQRNYTELYPTLSQDADRGNMEQFIEVLCEQTGGSRWLSYQNTDQQLQESYEQIRQLAWGIILFVGLIGILNIINTVYTNIHTRIVEIGVQRAIGMGTGSLYKTFLWEGMYYGIIAAIIGSIAGYICTIFVNAAATDTIEFVAVPALSVLWATIFSVLACLIATCIPLKKSTKISIVEAIETVE